MNHDINVHELLSKDVSCFFIFFNCQASYFSYKLSDTKLDKTAKVFILSYLSWEFNTKKVFHSKKSLRQVLTINGWNDYSVNSKTPSNSFYENAYFSTFWSSTILHSFHIKINLVTISRTISNFHSKNYLINPLIIARMREKIDIGKADTAEYHYLFCSLMWITTQSILSPTSISLFCLIMTFVMPKHILWNNNYDY